MPVTTKYAWETPEYTDPPDVPGDMQRLATVIEETVMGLDDQLTVLTGSSSSQMQYTALTRAVSDPQNIANAVWTPVVWDTPQYNLPTTAPGWTAKSPNRITCIQSGLYHFDGFAGFKSNATGSRGVAFRVNGNPSYPAISTGDNPGAGIGWYGCVSCEVKVNAGDWIELVVRQSSGAPLLMDSVFPRFSVRRMV